MPSPPTPVVLDLRDAPKKERRARLLDCSAMVQHGFDLWLASDETTTIERLSPIGDNAFGEYTSFPLSSYLELPASEDEEIDIEGLGVEKNYLWVVGSHSLKRQKPEREGDAEEDIQALSHIVRETNRFMLARIPVLTNSETGRSELHKRCPDPSHPRRELTAAQLIGTAKSNLLIDALRDDPHLWRFLAIPAKENGFDIEGIVVMGSRIFLGLRGPVLRGWAVVLELKIELVSDSLFRLVPIGPEKNLYRKHFFDLCGLGVREICQDGDDILLLAGPTMDLDGRVLVYRWCNATKHRKQVVVGRDALEVVLDFPIAKDAEPGKDHPEGMCLYTREGEKDGLLVVYDAPSADRLKGKHAMIADLFDMKE